MGTAFSLPSNHPAVVDSNIKQELQMLNSFNSTNMGVQPEFNTIVMGVTKISTEVDDEVITVSIELQRPGLLIGVAGENIQRLQDWLENCVSMQVRINLIESKLFS